MWKNHHMRTVTNYFIVNLSLADILVTITCLPATLVVDITETWFFGQPLCKVIPYLQVLFYCVCVHMAHVMKKRKNYSIFLIVIIWWKSIPATEVGISGYMLRIKGLFHLWLCLCLILFLVHLIVRPGQYTFWNICLVLSTFCDLF